MPDKKPKPVIDPATCSHPLLSRHIDREHGGFTGNWVCQRCKQEFCHLIPAVTSSTEWNQIGNDTCLSWNYVASIPSASFWSWTVTSDHDN